MIIEVTCHTAGCGNAGHRIALEVDEAPDAVECGVCGQAITDLT
jgi:hypothetical protein